jgi:NitT/TauT family transport system ATP-binding protein
VKFTVLFVTHSIEEAIRIGNRILLLSPHPGQVRAELRSEGWTRDGNHAESFLGLERQIHDILFTDQVEDTARGKTHA